MIRITSWTKRPLIYSLILAFGTYINIFILLNENFSTFIYGSIILFVLLIIEIYYTYKLGNDLLDQFNLPEINDKHKLANRIQQFILPTLLYIGVYIFIFFNKILILNYFISIIIFILYFITFSNIKAYYEDKFIIEEKTNYIYDILTIIIYALLIYSIVTFTLYFRIPLYYSLIVIIILSLLTKIFTIFRHNTFELKKYLLPIEILNIGLFLILEYFGISEFKLAFILTIPLYIFIANIHHYKDFTKSLKLYEEYFVLILIFILLLIL